MKRWIVLLLALALVAGMPSAVLAQTQTAFLYGDIDENGKIEAADALTALQSLVDLHRLTDRERIAADVDVSRKVDATDALFILQHVVGLITHFAAEANGRAAINPYTGGSSYLSRYQGEDSMGEATFMQIEQSYGNLYHLPVDMVTMVASSPSAVQTAYEQWEHNADGRKLGFMISSANAGREFFTMFPDRGYKDCETDALGQVQEWLGTPYVMPTQAVIEYQWELVEACCQCDPELIVFQEPLTRILHCYNEGFKEEWAAYYGEDDPWQDPASSPEARYKAAKLIDHMWDNFVNTIGKRMKESYPDVKLIMGSNGVIGYGSSGACAALSRFGMSEYVDGYLAQTWSDSAYDPVPYAGQNANRPFESGYLGYRQFMDIAGGRPLYALNDAASNHDYSWELRRQLWADTLAAQLLQPEITRFESIIWPDRCYAGADDDYRTVQLTIDALLQKIGAWDSELYSGSTGISVALSDTYAYQDVTPAGYTNKQALYGLTIPLVERGIPVSFTWLDRLESAEDLAGVGLLLVSYDMIQPKSEKVNEILAGWVKEGGVLLAVGGAGTLDDAPGEWWGKQSQTPFSNLIQHLGVQLETSALGDIAACAWSGDPQFGQGIDGMVLPSGAWDTAQVYQGDGEAFLAAEGLATEAKTLGMQWSIGKGRLLAVGLPSGVFAQGIEGPDAVRALVRYAASFTDRYYLESDVMTARRGDIVVSHAMNHAQGVTLTGDFADLLDPNLTITDTVELAAGQSSILYDLSALRSESVPKLVSAGGILKQMISETADTTRFTLTGPADSTAAALLLGNGRTPQSITVTLDGKPYSLWSSQWTNASESLLLKLRTVPEGVLDVTVVWGSGANPTIPPPGFARRTILTNDGNADADYIVSSNAQVDGSCRFCDQDRSITYAVDLSKYKNAVITVNVKRNYLLEASSHDGDYVVVGDSRTLSPTPTVGDGANSSYTIRPEEIGAEGKVYFRLSNSVPTAGWGGAIRSFSIQYFEPEA